MALGLPRNFGCQAGNVPWQGQAGKAAALSGSCSPATRAQVQTHSINHPVREIDAAAVIDGSESAAATAKWLLEQKGIPLAYSSADPAVVAAIQTRFGRERAAQALEQFFAETARILVAGGVNRLITAGGETSGAVVEGLALQELTIGPEIDPGVPCLRASENLVLALKSGNFGAKDFFAKADQTLAGS